MRIKATNSEKYKVVLISLYNPFSLSVRTLHSVIKNIESCEVYSIFFEHINGKDKIKTVIEDKSFYPLSRIISEIKPDSIGISVNSCVVRIARKITEELKRNFKSHIIWGGVYPTLHPEESLKYADMVCIGEGEDTIKELILKLSQKDNIYNIQGMWFRKNGGIIKNEMRPLIKDLDRLPYPDFSDSGKFYICGTKSYPRMPFYRVAHRFVYHIMTNRNCPYNCNFCIHHLLRSQYKGQPYIRRRSVENVIRELIKAKEYNDKLKYIYFYDENFILNKDWLNQFCLQYKKYINLPFFCSSHPNTIDEDVVVKLKNLGLDRICIGIEASSKCSADVFNRPYSEKKFLEKAYMLRRQKIKVIFDIINSNPFENHMEFFNFLSKLPKPYVLNTHDLNFFEAYEISNIALRRGLISKRDMVEHQKEVIKWDLFLSLRKDRNQLTWECLYYLIQKRGIPNRVLRYLVKYNFFRKSVILLVPICMLSYSIERYCKLLYQYIRNVVYLFYQK